MFFGMHENAGLRGNESGARFFSPTLRSNLLLRPGKWQENQSVIAGEAGWGKTIPESCLIFRPDRQYPHP